MSKQLIKYYGEPRADGSRYAKVWCPACKQAHAVGIGGKAWKLTGTEERPTLHPSLLVRGGSDDKHCHFWVRDGQLVYCADSKHALAGQTVPMEPFDD